MAYEAIITLDEQGYSVEFPDITGCSTQGNDLGDAYAMAYDVLGLIVTDAIQSGGGTEMGSASIDAARVDGLDISLARG